MMSASAFSPSGAHSPALVSSTSLSLSSHLFQIHSHSSLPPAPSFHHSHLPFLLPSLRSPPLFGWGSRARLVEGKKAPSHLPSNEQLLCTPPALTEPKWPTHFTLLGLDLTGLWVTGSMASLRMIPCREKKNKNRRNDVTRSLWWETLCSCFHCYKEVGQWSVRWCCYPRGFKEEGCLMASSLSSTVYESVFIKRLFILHFPTWLEDFWSRGISTGKWFTSMS